MSVTLAKQIEGLRKAAFEARTWMEHANEPDDESNTKEQYRLIVLHDLALALAATPEVQPVTADEVVERVTEGLFGTHYVWGKYATRQEAARRIAEKVVDALGPVYVVKEQEK
jgi:hypothetical protein